MESKAARTGGTSSQYRHVMRILSAIVPLRVAARKRPLLLCAVLSCVATWARAYAAVQTSPSDNSGGAVVVRLVDVDGKPVEGAHVGDFVGFDHESKEPADQSGWHYSSHAVSDRNGLARITNDRELPTCLVARHVGRKLVAIQRLSPTQLKDVVAVKMQPQCRVSGRLVSKELEAHNRKITWSIAYLHSGEKRPSYCFSGQTSFHFYVPPGAYKLVAYGLETYEANPTITVPPGQQELALEPINLVPKPWVLLEGRPAPELREIVAWKNSGPLRLADLRGKAVLLEFWNYQCGPCVGSMPLLFSIYDKYHDKGLVTIGIHVDAGQEIDSAAKLDEKLAEIKKAHWKGRDIPFPVALLLERRVPFRPDVQRTACCPLAADYGVDGVPTGMLIDRQGRLVGICLVGYKPHEALLEKTINEK